jgi:hypothetical protein
MGNRHHHKKERADARARAARTGESYQTALAKIRAGRRPDDLVTFRAFGVEITIAALSILDRVAVVFVSDLARPSPRSPLRSLGPRAIH